MSDTTFTPGLTPNTVRTADGKVLTVPDGWVLLPPGDAALTRRVKAAGDHWVVQEKKGRKIFSRGVWAPAASIERIRTELEVERSTESFAKRKAADAKRRGKAQEVYVEDFTGAVVTFLERVTALAGRVFFASCEIISPQCASNNLSAPAKNLRTICRPLRLTSQHNNKSRPGEAA